MLDFFPTAYAATSRTTSTSDAGAASAIGVVFAIIMLAWYVVVIVQAILGYGTAYRKTKANGDNGVSLFGWMILYCSLAALVPGLGIYLWKKSKEEPQAAGYQQVNSYQQQWQGQQPAQATQAPIVNSAMQVDQQQTTGTTQAATPAQAPVQAQTPSQANAAVTCPTCGAALNSNTPFCTNCGAPISR